MKLSKNWMRNVNIQEEMMKKTKIFSCCHPFVCWRNPFTAESERLSISPLQEVRRKKSENKKRESLQNLSSLSSSSSLSLSVSLLVYRTCCIRYYVQYNYRNSIFFVILFPPLSSCSEFHLGLERISSFVGRRRVVARELDMPGFLSLIWSETKWKLRENPFLLRHEDFI